MIFRFIKRMLVEVDLRLLLKFGYNMGWKSIRAISKFKKRVKKGELFPAFLMISVTNQCNFNCQGCWVTIDNNSNGINPDTLNNIIQESKKKGSYFFGLLGGEPFMYPNILDILEAHPDCYFQIFTNGSLLTHEIGERLRKMGNVTPLISIEGLESVSNIRRGAKNVYQRSVSGLEAATKNRLITGVATSVCKSNFKELVSEEFVKQCIQSGAHYLWYYIYRPVGPKPTRELILSEDEILALRNFLVEIRKKAPIIIIDTYWDKDGNAMCPGAIGMSHHINPWGDIEFCPPMQFAAETLGDGTDLVRMIENSTFLREMRSQITECTRGCLLLENPEKLKELVTNLNAFDSSKRNSAYQELSAMQACAGHNIPGKEIPEKSWIYRFAKKYWFFGFGAYG